jgi:AraC family transcriptional regulator
MFQTNDNTRPEYRQALGKVLHYINQNLAGDMSLETLAGIANYSPFHFQKIFLESLSETPRQYVIRLRMERAAHFIKLFPDLPIRDIAEGCGFTSPSVFSRSFRSWFGISANSYREMPMGSQPTPVTGKSHAAAFEGDPWIAPIGDFTGKINGATIGPPPEVCTVYPFQLACLPTTLSHSDNISFAFRSLRQWATPLGLITPSTRYFGIWLDFPFITVYNQCRYLCGIDVPPGIKPARGISLLAVEKGQYIRFVVAGGINDTLNSLVAVNHIHLDEMGYAISKMICYEEFGGNPIENPYGNNSRTILLPVRPR